MDNGALLWSYAYNGRNRLSIAQQNGTTIGTYVYNAGGQRIAKVLTGTTTRFVYEEASQLLSETSGTTGRDYIAVAGVPLAVADGATVGFITADGLGSPRLVTSVGVRWCGRGRMPRIPSARAARHRHPATFSIFGCRASTLTMKQG